ncbi:hypothetical protein NDU88_008844 [Pleurodeles waltl]|uniref:Uncharacterized protein n=1 Tax=Pleurodeles waltl TaxID=8319 RepID=A0AAV7RTM1_PLEWA|nr:hypothetical protein NDU88_008844 [Pleurodeles waltl]
MTEETTEKDEDDRTPTNVSGGSSVPPEPSAPFECGKKEKIRKPAVPIGDEESRFREAGREAGCPSNRTLPLGRARRSAVLPLDFFTRGGLPQQQDASRGHAGRARSLHCPHLGQAVPSTGRSRQTRWAERRAPRVLPPFLFGGAAHHKRPLRSGDSAAHFLRSTSGDRSPGIHG